MKERVAQTLGRQAKGLMISTFHTLGLEIIKREYKALELKLNFHYLMIRPICITKELTADLLEEDKDLLSQLKSQISNWKK